MERLQFDTEIVMESPDHTPFIFIYENCCPGLIFHQCVTGKIIDFRRDMSEPVRISRSCWRSWDDWVEIEKLNNQAVLERNKCMRFCI